MSCFKFCVYNTAHHVPPLSSPPLPELKSPIGELKASTHPVARRIWMSSCRPLDPVSYYCYPSSIKVNCPHAYHIDICGCTCTCVMAEVCMPELIMLYAHVHVHVGSYSTPNLAVPLQPLKYYQPTFHTCICTYVDALPYLTELPNLNLLI